ncbi:sensor domain-containing diguanylate cyclase [Hydrogenovibrio kuenenii]|uniref:sensor domain-containing diguanylate cyclase n=1 Tax=Hydrogenovibrio kuenenii TaxID=63658 RepID=UPI0004659773|nr:sensor domain-containing diguanylate cyclase [Hydrogenovibrio kuenenii]
MDFSSSDCYRFKTFIENMNDAIVVENESGELVLANQAFCDLFNITASPDDLIGMDCSYSAQQSKHLFKDPERFIERKNEILKDKEPVRHELLEMVGDKFLERDFIPIFENGEYVGLVWVFKDLTTHYIMESQLMMLTEKIREQSLTDSLTGIGNRRYLDSELPKYCDYAKRHNTPLCIAIIDIDYFKSINDEYGHEIGDQALVHVANYLKASVRSSDLIGRMGGEEFMVVMPETSLADAAKRISDLHASYQSPSVLNKRMTFSVGVSCVLPERDFKTSLNSADQALYQAKREGRDRVVVSED